MASIAAMLEDTSTKMSQVREQLINSEILADVTFMVGQNQIPIKAHKIYLATSSIVFFKMFSSSFQTPPIINIPDIEHECFLQLLRHIYGLPIELTNENLFDIWYGAEKYMLNELLTMCRTYLLGRFEKYELNLLEVFNEHRLMNDVNRLCLKVITEDPYCYLEYVEQLLNLSASAFAQIVQSKKINCTLDDLKATTLKWLNTALSTNYMEMDDSAYEALKGVGIERSWFLEKQFTDNVTMNVLEGSLCLHRAIETCVRLKTSTLVFGIGIILGVADDKDFPDNHEKIEICITINEEMIYLKEIELVQTTNQTILPIMFEKIDVGYNDCLVSVYLSRERERERWSRRTPNTCLYSSEPYSYSLISYVIESDNAQKPED